MKRKTAATRRARIAILGGQDEAEVQRILDALRARKERTLLIDTAGFPWYHRLTFSAGHWSYDGHPLDVIRAYFLRNLNCMPREVEEGATVLQRAMTTAVLREKDSMLGSLLRVAASECAIVNPVDSLRCHFYKLETIERLRRTNVPTPATLGTNDLAEARRFAEAHQQLIYKPLAGGAEAVALSLADLEGDVLDKARIAPVMLQERIYGEDVRAYVLGGEIIAAAALSTPHVDFRSGPQAFEPTVLTPAESNDVVASARLMSLDFASIDFKRSPTRGHVILDVNPAPMFAGFEQITGLDVAGPVARHLAARAA